MNILTALHNANPNDLEAMHDCIRQRDDAELGRLVREKVRACRLETASLPDYDVDFEYDAIGDQILIYAIRMHDASAKMMRRIEWELEDLRQRNRQEAADEERIARFEDERSCRRASV